MDLEEIADDIAQEIEDKIAVIEDYVDRDLRIRSMLDLGPLLLVNFILGKILEVILPKKTINKRGS